MSDNLSKLPSAIRIARKTVRIASENIIFALGVKIAVMILGAFGFANMWLAVFADVGVAALAILNSMRTLGGK
jgi:Cd2+/Zn2+-exporting ATPase